MEQEKELPYPWKVFSVFDIPVYEMSCLYNVLSMKCPVCEMSYDPIYEMPCLWNVLSVKCPIYEMSCLWNVLSVKCPVCEMSYPWNVLSMKFLSIKFVPTPKKNIQTWIWCFLSSNRTFFVIFDTDKFSCLFSNIVNLDWNWWCILLNINSPPPSQLRSWYG